MPSPDDPAVNEWDAHAAEWDSDDAAQAYAAAAHDSLIEVLKERSLALADMQVIDFGCGTGLLTDHLVGSAVRSVLAIDSSDGMLAVLRRKIDQRGWTNVAAAHALPSVGDGVDLVVCSSVCAFVDDYPATVAALFERLSPGGVFVQWDWERVGDDPHGLTRAAITECLTSVGLVEVQVATAFEVEAHGQVMRPLRGVGQRPLVEPA